MLYHILDALAFMLAVCLMAGFAFLPEVLDFVYHRLYPRDQG